MGRDSRGNPFTQRQVLGLAGPERPSLQHAVDGMGRVLQPADAVFWMSAGEKLFRVADVRAVMDPTMPPGLVAVDLICVQTLIVKGGESIGNVVRVAPAAEAPPMPVQVVGTQPMPAPEPGDDPDAAARVGEAEARARLLGAES